MNTSPETLEYTNAKTEEKKTLKKTSEPINHKTHPEKIDEIRERFSKKYRPDKK